MIMTPERLAEIEARVNAATPEPWKTIKYFGSDSYYWDIYRIPDLTSVNIATAITDESNAEFIANSRQDIADLLADRQYLLNFIQELSNKNLQLKSDNQKLREALKPFALLYTFEAAEAQTYGNKYQIVILHISDTAKADATLIETERKC